MDGITIQYTGLLDDASLNLLHFQSVFDCFLFCKLADKISIYVQVSCFVSCSLVVWYVVLMFICITCCYAAQTNGSSEFDCVVAASAVLHKEFD